MVHFQILFSQNFDMIQCLKFVHCNHYSQRGDTIQTDKTDKTILEDIIGLWNKITKKNMIISNNVIVCVDENECEIIFTFVFIDTYNHIIRNNHIFFSDLIPQTDYIHIIGLWNKITKKNMIISNNVIVCVDENECEYDFNSGSSIII
jgi:hypothetical protein